MSDNMIIIEKFKKEAMQINEQLLLVLRENLPRSRVEKPNKVKDINQQKEL